MTESVTVCVPATTANLGPGFDCMALALDLWNQATFSLTGQGIQIEVLGEGSGNIPENQKNLVARAALFLFKKQDKPMPAGLKITCINKIPLGSGLGSSAAACLAGLMGANALLGTPATNEELLRMCNELEGHPDNAAAALLGGLVVVVQQGSELLTQHYSVQGLRIAAVVPKINLPTAVARAALPAKVPLNDAVFNLGRTALVVTALRTGDFDLLRKVVDDRLHQPYRIKMISGGGAALAAARELGAAAFISGAGPGMVAVTPNDPDPIRDAMINAFNQAGIQARGWSLSISEKGAHLA